MDSKITGIPRETIRQNRSNIKKSVSPKSFFQYVPSDWLKIRRFSRSNGIIKFRFFFFMFLDPALSMRFSEQIQQTLLRSLHKSLLPIKENGWRVFSKLVYNKLIFLCNFVESLMNVEPQVFNRLTGNILESLREIEHAFYILYSDPTLLSSLEKELEIYVKVVKQKGFPVDGIIRSIQTLLSHNENQFTLYSLFTALNSIHFKRHCDVKIMIQEGGGPYFYADDFDLTEPARIQLSNYTGEVIIAIKKHLTVHREIALFKNFIPTRAGERHDIEVLKEFYNMAGEVTTEDRYTNDHQNMLLLMANFARKSAAEFKRILTGEIALNDQKNARIFEDRLFSNYFGRIDFFKKKLDTLMLKSPGLKRERYFAVRSGETRPEEDEATVGVISELLTIYFQMARVLASVLKYAISAANSEAVPVIRLIPFKDIQFFIPFEHSVQFSSSFLSGKTVREALNIITEIFLILCLDLGESELMSIINKDRNALVSLRQFIKELRRISTESSFNEVRKKLHFAGVEDE